MPNTPPLVLDQRPAPHACIVRHAGDSLRVTLTTSHPVQGHAFVRTNVGNAVIHRAEIIYHVEMGADPMGRDWRDIPMRKLGASLYEVKLPLAEVGTFEFKCFFLDEATGKTYWPRGENARVKIISAMGVADNTIYNAFIRQFGDNISGGAMTTEQRKAAELLDKNNFTVIPPSGTFRVLQSKLDFIIEKMGFRILQFLPVHPTPTTYARMGRYGSPFAPLDFFDVDPAMAEFDHRTTPLEQFQELVDQVHARGAMVFLDLPIDHTGWNSVLQSHHPDWFARTPDGSFESPGAWGVVWADLCKLDFSKTDLWKHLAEVFLHWCENGVDGFRCDAGYMIPEPVWEYIVAKVRQQYPDTLFFLEGLGGGEEATTRLLRDADLDWAYSEFFQNYSKQELSHYLEYAFRYSNAHGALVNFAETHDNDRLAAKSPAWARLRVAMAALFAPAGCFGIANGVEWFATEKIDVHGSKSLNWDASENMVDWLAKLNGLLKEHPAFRADATSRTPYGANGTDAVGLLRVPRENNEFAILVVASTRTDAGGAFQWHFQEFDPGAHPVDLLTGKSLPATLDQCLYHINLKPGQVVCLCKPASQKLPKQPFGALVRQQLRAVALRLRVSIQETQDLDKVDVDRDAMSLYQNPREYLRTLTTEKKYLPLVEWMPLLDRNRQAILPDDHILLIIHDKPFYAATCIANEVRQRYHSLPMADGRHFAFFKRSRLPLTRETQAFLRMSIFGDDGKPQRFISPITILPMRGTPSVTRRITHRELTPRHSVLTTNIRGSYGMLRGMWGLQEGRYEALLAVNQNPDHPADRTIVFSRIRAWLVHHDFAQEINFKCQTDFSIAAANSASWHFIVPSGVGGNAYLGIRYEMDKETNRCRLIFSRCQPPEEEDILPSLDAHSPITLLIRPDIDDCCNHECTQAYLGAEHQFPQRITAHESGFDFALSSGNRLEARISRGAFLNDGEWNYNVHSKIEEERGLRADRDLYSPGHFRFDLRRGESAVLEAAVLTTEETPMPIPAEPAQCPAFHETGVTISLKNALLQAMDAFVVQRKPLKTVMAGYPWFLDWGRDTLICLRGLIAAGRLEDSLAIIQQFASFEENGTIPNMISGSDVSNRDTTDAPLWLFNAVDEYVKAVGKGKAAEVLATPCGKRSLLEVLKSIVENYKKGTPNGISVDSESMLVYSPAHFTWMDTNFPAGTPREGYPIEIQALWFQALDFLARSTQKDSYAKDAAKVRESVLKYFISTAHNVGLSDCLHATSGTTAANAVPDDACRPNQLFALTVDGLITDIAVRSKVILAVEHLLVPGAMRTLADQPVKYPLPVYKDGQLLNNPQTPYWGQYIGDEDTRRKPAYHNGTAWPWLMPSFCEAIFQTYGESAKIAALSLFHSTASLMRRGCLGHLTEIMDGNYPHATRGCSAQAWSVTEAFRVLKLLEK